MARKDPEGTREAILQAAMQRIQEFGVATLSLDAVASDAGSSKGGLLHHFPTKDALLKGVISFLVTRFESRMAAEMANDQDDTPGRWLRAYIRTNLDGDPAITQVHAQITQAFPGLTAYSDEVYDASPLLGYQDDGIPPERALLIRAACDGWWVAECFGAPIVRPEERATLRDALLALAR